MGPRTPPPLCLRLLFACASRAVFCALAVGIAHAQVHKDAIPAQPIVKPKPELVHKPVAPAQVPPKATVPKAQVPLPQTEVQKADLPKVGVPKPHEPPTEVHKADLPKVQLPPEAPVAATVPASKAWQLPAVVPAAAVSIPAAASEAPADPKALSAVRARQMTEVLQRHGFAGNLATDAKLGLPSEILTDRTRVSAVLGDLRMLNPPPGDMTVRSVRRPETQDKETTEALEDLRRNNALGTVTAVGSLTDEPSRRRKQQQCGDAAVALDAQEANVRTIGGSAEPGAYHGSEAFWNAVERVNAQAAETYRRAASTYAAACLDTQWQALTPAQRADMAAVVGFLHIEGQAQCMGSRIARDRFLTARHCLYRYDRNTGWERLPVQRLHVALAGRAGESFDVEELACDKPQPDAQCSPMVAGNPLAADHLVLRLKPHGPGAKLPPMPALKVDQAAVRQMLVVPGRSTWITGRALKPDDPVYVTTADIGGCMIKRDEEGCLVNACQSESGFSGAPMFARRQVDELVLVGLFLGSTAHNPYRQCQWPESNFGAKLPPPVYSALR